MRWAEHAAREGETRRAGKRPLAKPGHRCEDNIRMDLRRCNVTIWTGL